MNDIKIECPHCKKEFELMAALSSKQYENMLAEEAKKIRTDIAQANAKTLIEVKAQADKDKVEQANKAKADKEALQDRINTISRDMEDMHTKLKEAQDVQAKALLKEVQLKAQERELELIIAKRVAEESAQAVDKAKEYIHEEHSLKIMERDKIIKDMQNQVDILKRKSEQTSQQLQGEVQELELEKLLKENFPLDNITPVGKGEFGGDCTQQVEGGATILWESKRTKTFSHGWIQKLKDDMRSAKASCAVLVTHTLPQDVKSFDLIEGVYVIGVPYVKAVATLIRVAMQEVQAAQRNNRGIDTKAGLVYQYLIGPIFKSKIETIIEAFNSMSDDLARERKAIEKMWAKRAMQIDRVVTSTVGMYGDLQGIAGKSLQELKAMDVDSIAAPTD